MSQGLAKADAPDMMGLLQLAISKESAIDVIERLAAMQREARDHFAMVSFNQALHRAQGKLKRVAADMENPQTHSRYASYAQVDRAVRPVYVEEGFSLSFSDGESPHPDKLRQLCYVSHADGHTRMYQKDMAIDTKGPKGNDVMTKTHAHGSADLYAKRRLVLNIFNLAVGNEDDDDGNGGGNMDEREFVDLCDNIEGAGDLEGLERIFKKAYRTAMEAEDKQAQTSFIEKKDKRKKELRDAIR